MMPHQEERQVGDIIPGPWGSTDVMEAEWVEVVDDQERDQAPKPQTIRATASRVVESGRTTIGQLQQLKDSEAVRGRTERINAALGEVRDGLKARNRDRDQEFLEQFHEDNDLSMPVRPERFSEYRWAVERVEKRREAEVKRRESMSDVDKTLEYAHEYGGAATGGTGLALALVDAASGGVPNWASVLGFAVGGGYTLYKTRQLRKAGREYRHELVRKAFLREQASAEVLVDGDKPVRPIAEATHEEEALEFTRRALLSNDLRTRPVVAERRVFGWRVVVDLVGGTKKTPEDVGKAAPRLEVDLGLGENGVLVQPSRDNRARVTLWIIQRDPFADLPAPESYQPRSRSILDPIYVGKRLDGALVSIQVPSTHGVVLAPTGGGKSILLRALVDGVAAARDAIAWDLDPSGRGQAAQAKVFRRRALTPKDCTKALKLAVQVASVRAALNLDDDWPVSPEHPALVIFCDEFPQLDEKGQGGRTGVAAHRPQGRGVAGVRCSGPQGQHPRCRRGRRDGPEGRRPGPE